MSARQTKIPRAVLVAGGAGFLGSHLIETLLLQNLQVLCLDNLTTGNKKNIENFFHRPNFTFIEHDITKPLSKTLAKSDYIFHLAAVEEYLNGFDVSVETLLTNSLGTKNLLELASQNNAKILLVSSVDLYHGVLSSSSLSHYFGISKKDRQKYTHHESKRFAEALASQYYEKHHLDIRIVRLADVYGPKMLLLSGTEISRLIKESLEKETLTIHGDGLEILHPTYIADVIYGLTKAMFSENSQGKIYTLVNPQEITVLNFASALQKISQKSLKILYSESKNEFKFPVRSIDIHQSQSDLNWQPITPLETGLQQTLAFFQGKTKTESVEPSKPPIFPEPSEIPQTSPSSVSQLPAAEKSFPLQKSCFSFFTSRFPYIILLFTFFAFLLVLFWPLISSFYQAKKGFSHLIHAKNVFSQTNFPQTQKSATFALQNFQSAQENLLQISPLFSFFPSRGLVNYYQENLSFGKTAAETAILSSQIALDVKKIFNYILDPSLNLVFEKEIENLRVNLDLLSQKLSLLQTQTPSAALLSMQNQFSPRLASTDFSYYHSFISSFNFSLQYLPEILGLNGKRTYLFLFQNNMELRPTGGFIGSYALAVFDQGRLLELRVDDVYTADGQLKGHVDPPDEILHFLGQPNWYLRDSNWSPDFPLSAQRAAWFLEKELGYQPDAVIALNLTSVQYLLQAVGQVQIPEYQEVITAENLFERAETKSEVDFFPGSDQKKNFLASLTKSLIEKIKRGEVENPQLFLQKLQQSLSEKHLLLYSTNSELQKLITQNNWGGTFSSHLPSQTSNSDYLLLIESNLGSNKANAFVKRQFSQEVTIGKEGEITKKLILKFINNSPADTWPGGRYKNYIRLYVPADAELIKIDIPEKKGILSEIISEKVLKSLSDNEFLIHETITTPTPTATQNTAAKLKSWGFLVEISVKSQKSIEITYHLNKKLEFQKGIAEYHLFWQKQPGIGHDPIFLTVNYPSYLKILTTAPPSLQSSPSSSQVLRFSSDISTDRQFQVKFYK